jgi:hypothetical protein
LVLLLVLLLLLLLLLFLEHQISRSSHGLDVEHFSSVAIFKSKALLCAS